MTQLRSTNISPRGRDGLRYCCRTAVRRRCVCSRQRAMFWPQRDATCRLLASEQRLVRARCRPYKGRRSVRPCSAACQYCTSNYKGRRSVNVQFVPQRAVARRVRSRRSRGAAARRADFIQRAAARCAAAAAREELPHAVQWPRWRLDSTPHAAPAHVRSQLLRAAGCAEIEAGGVTVASVPSLISLCLDEASTRAGPATCGPAG